MQEKRADTTTAKQNLPALAPRESQSASSSDPGPCSSRQRLSHRSRAGCWTCRGRKVKCDETRPKCGPCTRLNKVCDWNHRWNFSDATTTTQSKYANVSTEGSSVWDPRASRASRSARSSASPPHDDLPSFAALTNDEDRERKAGRRAPGTFNVIVNPESFSSLPEYASSFGDRSSDRRFSTQSMHSSFGPGSDTSRATLSEDPNVIVLSKFEDASPSLQGFITASADRRPSFPEDMPGGLGLPMMSPDATILPSLPERTISAPSEAVLLSYYETFIGPRILVFSRHTREIPRGVDPIVAESRMFRPLHHAICAISSLSLYYKGQARREDALQQYMQATRLLSRSITSTSDTSSDGVFFMHYLLLIYDMCNSFDESNLWQSHVQQLLRISREGHLVRKGEPHGFMAGFVLFQDAQACLAGSGTGDYVRAYLNQEIVMPEYLQSEQSLQRTLFPEEEHTMPALTALSRQVTTFMAKMSMLALQLRADFSNFRNNPQAMAARQHMIRQFQTEFYSTWANSFPSHLVPNSPLAGLNLPPRVRMLFDHAFLYFSYLVIYSNTSMYPGQGLDNPGAKAEIALHCTNILVLANSVVESQLWDHHFIINATFIAGVYTSNQNEKVQAINIIRAMEGRGIAHNAMRCRKLLVIVCEEQQRRIMEGGREEEVDWIGVSRARGLQMVDFGL